MLVTWEKKGPQNTINTLELAYNRGFELGINNIVVASNSGKTIQELSKIISSNNSQIDNLNIVCVTHHVGFSKPGHDEMPLETRKELEKKGIKLLTTTHLFAGVDRAVRNKFGGVYPAEIIAQTLRIFGQGIKVAIETSCMALDAGFIPFGENIIAVGGSGIGADSAIIINPAHSNNFFDCEIPEIICMPRKK